MGPGPGLWVLVLCRALQSVFSWLLSCEEAFYLPCFLQTGGLTKPSFFFPFWQEHFV
jgi:hypothetical protein